MALPKFISGPNDDVIEESITKGQILIGTYSDGTASMYVDASDKYDNNTVKRYEVSPLPADDISELQTKVAAIETLLGDNTIIAGDDDSGSGSGGGGDDPNPGGGDDPNPGGGDDPVTPEPEEVLNDVEEASAVLDPNSFEVTLKWLDPGDKYSGGQLVGEWAGTLVVRKEGAIPANHEDGTVVVDSTIQDQYADDGFVDDDELLRTKTYYYRFFPYTEDGKYTAGEVITITVPGIVISDVPAQNGTLTYDGTEQTADFDNFDTDELTVSNITATNAGTYQAIFTPKEGYWWSDETTTARTVNWTIDKAENNMALSETETTLLMTDASKTVTISNSCGTVTAVSDNNCAVVSLSNNEITITNPNQLQGVAYITVSDTGSDNYESKILTLKVYCSYVKIVSWANGSDTELKNMITAADNGQINLADYWTVGDERTVEGHISDGAGTTVSTTERLILLHPGQYAAGNNDTCSFVVGMPYVSLYHKNSSSYSNWKNSNLESIVRTVRSYSNGIPFITDLSQRSIWDSSVYNTIFKKFNEYTFDRTTNNLYTANIYCSIPAEKEVFNSKINSYQAEADALIGFDYFKTSSNRILYWMNYDSSTNTWTQEYDPPMARSWVTRSTTINNSSYVCGVSESGTSTTINASVDADDILRSYIIMVI